MRSGNPSLNDKVFQNLVWEPSARMTLQGTVVKSGVLLALVFISALFTWQMEAEALSLLYASHEAGKALGANELAVLSAATGRLYPFMIGGALGGLALAFLTFAKKNWAPVTAPLYALVEGLFLGAFSFVIQAQFLGVPIVLQALALTFGTFFCLLAAYTSRLIKPTENFKLGVVAATGGIFVVYILSFVLSFFGIEVPLLHSNGPIGIGISVFIVIIAALNLVLDFDFIENASDRGAPKYMEWYGAFGLLVTLIWLYVEFLRLLAKLNSRR